MDYIFEPLRIPIEIDDIQVWNSFVLCTLGVTKNTHRVVLS